MSERDEWTRRWTTALQQGWAFHLKADETITVQNPQGEVVGILPCLTWDSLKDATRLLDNMGVPK